MVASVTDGDIRRALLAGSSLDSPAALAYNTSFVSLFEGADWSSEIAEGSARGLTEYPVVDAGGALVGVESRPLRSGHTARANTVVIMAGGKGLRLRPLTEQTPKPLLRVGGKPVLQHIIENLRDEGFTDIVVAINYLGEQIEAHFGDGSSFGVHIKYLREETPLGTAGALSLLKPPFSSPLVVMNADLVVSARIGQLVDYHLTEKAIITVGAKIVETMVPFGVLGTKGHTIQVIEEKPTHKDLINAGVYVLNAEVVEQLEPSAPADMPELIAANVDSGSVLAFPLHEDWLDLGRPDDLRRARANTQED